MRHRGVVAAVLALVVVTAGCAGTPGGTSSATATPSEPTATSTSSGPTATPTPSGPTATPTPSEPTATATPSEPSGSVDFPDGPKEPPERPPALNASSVHEYVKRYEYRIAYNSLWVSENSTVTVACRVDEVTERPWGYEAVVTCTGSSKTDGLNGDWFTQSYRYDVSETAVDRTQVEPRESVS